MRILIITICLSFVVRAGYSQTKPDCRAGSAISTGDSVYKCGPDGKWVHDVQAEKESAAFMRAAEKHRVELIWAMRTRPLTTKEMKEVTERGTDLLYPICQGICSGMDAVSLSKELNELLLQQIRLRLLVDKPCEEK